MAFAVGLGKINVHSSLNQQLNAQVPIVDIGNVPLDSVQIKLASVEQFKLVGLDRDPNLSLLRFNVLRAANGQAYVQISSTEPVAAPVVTFLVNLTWPNGQMMREYTVFLDPVSYTHKVSTQLKPATSEQPSQTQQTQDNNLETVTYGPTTSQDDLWEVAKKTRLKNTSIQQNMVAIFKKNKRAFSHDSINQLRAGYILNLPTLQQVKAMSRADAVNFLKQQDKVSHEKSEPQKQQLVQTLPEPLTAAPKQQNNNSTKPEEIQLLPENQLMTEGDQFKPSATTKALGGESITQQQTKTVLAKQLVDMQKQLIAKDRQILALEKVLEENQSPQQTSSAQGQVAKQTASAAAMTEQQTQSAAQAGEIKIAYGLPWYTFPLLLFIVFISLLLGVFIQRHRIKMGYSNEGSKSRIDIPNVIKKFLERKSAAEPETDHFESIAEQSTTKTGLPEPDENASSKLDLMSNLPEIERLIGQKNYQQAIDRLKTLHDSSTTQFDINLKLLELYGLAQQQDNFKKCYQELLGSGLTATEKTVLESISSMFLDVPHERPAEQTDFDNVVADEGPETFSIDTVQAAPESEPDVVSEPEVELDKEQASEKESPSDTDDAKSHVIEFDTSELSPINKVQSQAEKESDAIDEQVWDKMLDNLSVAPTEDSQVDIESDNMPNSGDEVDSTVERDVDSTPQPEAGLEAEDSSESKNDESEPEDFETQLNLATAYIEMGDIQEAKDILNHVVAQAPEEYKKAATALLEQL